jgi:RNA polymerase sigma-70 factor (ECF subfamily)
MTASRSQPRVLARRRDADDAASADEDDVRAQAPDLETIYRAHADAVATWARRLGGPALDVEDIVHEVFLVAQRRLPEWRGDAKITTWLYEITLRIVQERRRRWRWWPRLGGARDEARPGREEAGEPAARDPDALALLERREAGAALYELLDGIGEKYRTVIILFELEGRSGEEIAALTGASLANVWIRLHRGRQKLLKRLLAREAKGKS